MKKEIECIVTWHSGIGTEENLVTTINNGATGARLIAKGFTPETLRKVASELSHAGKTIKSNFHLMIDLPGCKPRLERIPTVKFSKGDLITLLAEGAPQEDDTSLPTEFLNPYLKKIKKGHKIKMIDGTVSFEVEEIYLDKVVCRVLNDCVLTEGRSINLPDSNVVYESFSESDRLSLNALTDVEFDSVGLSMVGSADEVSRVKEYLKKLKIHVPIISKIETRQGITNLEEIASVSDAIMVARGDMSIELPLEMVGVLQMHIIEISKSLGKDIILATGILSSASDAGFPTIAEVSDLTSFFPLGIRKFLLGGERHQEHSAKWLKKVYSEWKKRKDRVGVGANPLAD